MTEHRDLEARLGGALRSEAARATTDPAALALIRGRTRSPAPKAAGRFLRPAFAGAALTLAVALGTVAGVDLASDGAQPPGSAATVAKTLADTRVAAVPQPLHQVPPDDGGTYVAITGPDSAALLGRTFDVRGTARVLEARVTIEASQNGTVLAADHVDVSAAAPALGEWSASFTLPPGPYRIEAFYASPGGDGGRAALDTIWVTVT